MRITKIIGALLLSFLFLQTGMASEKIKIDIKIPVEEAEEFRLVVKGLRYYLLNDHQMKETEFGENYSVWFRHFKKTEYNNEIKISFTLEIRSPAFLNKGELIKGEKISFYYFKDDKICDGTRRQLVNYVGKKAAKYSDEELQQMMRGGKIAYYELKKLLDLIRKEKWQTD